MDGNVLTQHVPQIPTMARSRLRDELSMVPLGDVKQMWEAQKKVCGGNHEEFAKHVLILHMALCANFCDAESMQKNLTDYLRATHTHERRGMPPPQSYLAAHDPELSHQAKNTEILSLPLRESTRPDISQDPPSKGPSTWADVDPRPDKSSPEPLRNEHQYAKEPVRVSHAPLHAHELGIVPAPGGNVPGTEHGQTVPTEQNTQAELHVCYECGKSFNRRILLKIHKKTHKGLKMTSRGTKALYYCSECDIGFSGKQKFDMHILTHQSAVKAHECSVCDHEFSTRQKLNRHMLTHVGMQAYECSTCGKVFTKKQTLNIHMRTHVGKAQISMDLRHHGLKTSSLQDVGEDSSTEELSPLPDVGSPAASYKSLTPHISDHQYAKAWEEQVDEHEVPVESSSAKFLDREVAGKALSSKSYIGQLQNSMKATRLPYQLHELNKSTVTQVDERSSNKAIVINVMAFSEEVLDSCLQDPVVSPQIPVDDQKEEKDLYSELKLSHALAVKEGVIAEEFVIMDTPDVPHVTMNRDAQPRVVECNSVVPLSAQTHEKELYLCSICGMGAPLLADLSTHLIQSHTKNQAPNTSHKIKCKLQIHYRASKHKRVMNKPMKVKCHRCSHCDKRFSSLSQLKLHIITHNSAKLHACSCCDMRFRSRLSLRRHMLKHTVEKPPHTCDDCGKGFIIACELKLHRLMHTGEKPHLCSDCGKGFSLLGNLKKHQTIHHSVGKLHLCSYCGKVYAYAAGLRRHVLTHTDKKAHMCSLCDKAFTLLDYLKAHMTAVHSNHKPHMCSDCGKRFVRGRALRLHMRTHTKKKPRSPRKKPMILDTGEGSYLCSDCGKCFITLNSLKRHAVCHTRERSYVCAVCSKAFGYACVLKTHMMIHTGEKPYACSECDKRFITSSYLKTHLRFHRGEKPHVCSNCGRAFTQLSSLNKHLRTHTGEKPFVCSVCSKAVTTLRSLTKHMVLHTRKKAVHVCSNCGKIFAQLSMLNKHMRSHTREKPYACSECGEHFRWKANRTRHIQMKHTTERPHVCSVCLKAFSQPSDLKKHVVIHIGVKPYKCPYCAYAANYNSNLKKHMKIHTRGEVALIPDTLPNMITYEEHNPQMEVSQMEVQQMEVLIL